jgi:hypothetical protein
LVGDHGELHAERAQYGARGFIARMGAAAESLVKALAAVVESRLRADRTKRGASAAVAERAGGDFPIPPLRRAA